MATAYEKIYDWLSGYESLGDWLYFNVTNYEAGKTSLNSVASARQLKEDVTGVKTVELVFAIDMIKLYDGEMSSTNMDAINEVAAFGEWIERSSLPSLDGGRKATKLELVTNIPTLSVDNRNGLAKYQFQVKLTYKE